MHSGHLTRAILLPFMAAVAGYLSYVPDLYHFFEGVSHPEWSVSAQMWRNFGFGYYILMMVLFYQVTFKCEPKFPAVFWMLVFLLVFEEIWAYQLFSKQAFNFALFGAVVQTVVSVMIPFFLFKKEKWWLFLFIPILLWIGLYQLCWTYGVWTLTVGY